MNRLVPTVGEYVVCKRTGLRFRVTGVEPATRDTAARVRLQTSDKRLSDLVAISYIFEIYDPEPLTPW